MQASWAHEKSSNECQIWDDRHVVGNWQLPYGRILTLSLLELLHTNKGSTTSNLALLI